MAGTRTAPAMTAAATARRISYSFYDGTDQKTFAFYVPVAATAAAIEAVLADIASRSNASLFNIDDVMVREGVKSAANAVNEPRSGSVFDHIVLHFKVLATRVSTRLWIPANTEATMLDPGADVPSTADLADVATGAVALGLGAWVSARYNENKETNEAVSP